MAEEQGQQQQQPRTADVLSTHDTVATFTGTRHWPCRFRTALCPHECGHASDTLDFDVKHYLAYSKPGAARGDLQVLAGRDP